MNETTRNSLLSLITKNLFYYSGQWYLYVLCKHVQLYFTQDCNDILVSRFWHEPWWSWFYFLSRAKPTYFVRLVSMITVFSMLTTDKDISTEEVYLQSTIIPCRSLIVHHAIIDRNCVLQTRLTHAWFNSISGALIPSNEMGQTMGPNGRPAS